MVCAQCHVEYYFKGEGKLVTYPWDKGLKMENIEAYYNEVGHNDWKHKETGAGVLKAQHPEFEMWSQGIHARSGVACADCHMPYKREGALKFSDHHVRSPLLEPARSCQMSSQSESTCSATIRLPSTMVAAPMGTGTGATCASTAGRGCMTSVDIC